MGRFLVKYLGMSHERTFVIFAVLALAAGCGTVRAVREARLEQETWADRGTGKEAERPVEQVRLVGWKLPQLVGFALANRPSMTRALAYAGFTQTYGTFAWRNTRQEVDEFLVETNSDAAFWQHNAFWPTTPESLSNYLRDNAIAGYAVRAVLAAMGSPTWGVTSGYELVENTQRDGSEKPAVDEYGTPRVRDWDQAGNYGIAELVTTLNAVRAAHPATMSYHNLTLLPSANPAILAFARQTPAACTGTGKPDTLIVVVNLDGHHEQQSTIHVDLNALGLPTNGTYRVKDELTGREFDWSWDNYVALAPWADVAHILSVEY